MSWRQDPTHPLSRLLAKHTRRAMCPVHGPYVIEPPGSLRPRPWHCHEEGCGRVLVVGK